MVDERQAYALPTDSLPGLSFSHHVDDLAEIAEFLGTRGIDTRATRIERYAQFLPQAVELGVAEVGAHKIFKNSAGGPFESPIDWLLYVLREVHELMWILAGLKSHSPRGIDAKLKAVVGGRDFAALDTDSASRNTQFELHIASYFCQTGFEVDLSTDTDVIARTSDAEFYVECKRVTSGGQLGKRLSDARSQLEQRMPRKDGKRLVLGSIAVDVTKVAFTHNGLTWGITSEHSRDVLQQKLVAVADAAARVLKFGSPRKLLCYWLQVHIAALVLRPTPTPATRFSSFHIAKQNLTTKEAKVLRSFYQAFEEASGSDRRSLAPRKFTPRNGVTIPAGSTFSVEEDHLLHLLEQNSVSDNDRATTIASLKMGEGEYVFSFFELEMLPVDAVEEWRRNRVENPGHSHAVLVAQLYLQQHPYEEPQ